MNAINEIYYFINGEEHDFAAFQNDIKTRRDVERNIEIIGEAMNRILQMDEEFKMSNLER